MTRRGNAFRRRCHQPIKPAASVASRTPKNKSILKFGLAAITVLVLVSSIVATNIGGRGGELVYNALPDPQAVVVSASTTTLHTEFDLEPKTLDELLNLPGSELYKVDVARINLLCASDMPTTEGLEIEQALSVLDEWAEKVAEVTDRHLYRVTDPRPEYANRYKGSEAHFRAEMLAQVLQEDLGVHYNKSAIGNFSFVDPGVAFIYSMIPGPDQTIAETPGGTCASMPVLYVAVGRRLGYPLRLVTTQSHVFARWDGEASDNPVWRETFNCETTNGFCKYDDARYRTWPVPVTEEQVVVNGFLKSLSPAEEFALFLGARGHHGLDVGQLDFAARCYENACRYDTTRPCYRLWFLQAALPSGYQPDTLALHQMIASELAYREAAQWRQATGRTEGGLLPSQSQRRALGGTPTPGRLGPRHASTHIAAITAHRESTVPATPRPGRVLPTITEI